MPRITWTHSLAVYDVPACKRMSETGWWIPSPLWRDMIEEAEREDFRRQGLPI